MGPVLASLICIYVIVIVFNTCDKPVQAALVYYGPSIASLVSIPDKNSNEWMNNNAGSDNFNKIIGDTIFLEDYNSTFSVLIPLIPGKSYANHTEALTYFRGIHFAEFYVQAPQDYGVMAVVQILRLFAVSETSKQCMDFIKFREDLDTTFPNGTRQSRSTNKICGKDDEDDFDYHPKGLVGELNFVALSGKMAVEFLLVSTLLRDKWTNLQSDTEVVIASEISFTAFPLKARVVTVEIPNPSQIKDETSNNAQKKTGLGFFPLFLPPSHPASDNMPVDTTITVSKCILGDETEEDTNSSSWNPITTLLPCSTAQSNGFQELHCISSQLFCDDIIHCGGAGREFARDELFCTDYKSGSKNFKQFLENHHFLNQLDGSVVNGSRFTPQTIIEIEDVSVKVATSVIEVVCVVGVLAVGVSLLWWFLRCYGVACKKGGQNLEGDSDSGSGSGQTQGQKNIVQVANQNQRSVYLA